MKESVLYGFHGTLVDILGIRSLLEGDDRTAFYSASLTCPPVHSTVLAAQWARNAGYDNVIFTRMTSNYEEELRAWLSLHEVPFAYLGMRDVGDERADIVVKREMYLAAIASGHRIVRAWSSSPACLALWRLQGVPVVTVPSWATLPGAS